MEGHLPCLKFIVSVNRDISSILGARTDQGDTPKSLAEQFYKEDCCTYLDALEWEHDHPEQVESISNNSPSLSDGNVFLLLDLAFPAHVAAYNGDLDYVKLLVEQGVVSVNERDERGATLAHKAAGQGHMAVLQWLMEMGASMELTTQSGETPKDVARRFGQLACLKILGGGTDKIEPIVQRQQTESQQRKLSPKEEERARARQRFEELHKQFDIAKKNFRQLGGQFEEDQKRDTVEQDSQKYASSLSHLLFEMIIVGESKN